MKDRIIWCLKCIRAKNRLLLGMCPMCNSDAPELYDCPLCNYYSSASGDKFPPPKELKQKWWVEYKQVIDCKLFTMNAIKKHRKNRTS